MSRDDKGQLGYWETVSPLYATLCEDTQSVSLIATEYNADFKQFYEAVIANTAKYCNGHFVPQGKLPPNTISVSSLPWLDFTAVSFSDAATDNPFVPQLAIGKYKEQDGKMLMPISIQVHHAVCDGLHVGRFVEEARRLAESCEEWL